MDITSSTGRKRNNGCVNAEDNALNQITKEVCISMNGHYLSNFGKCLQDGLFRKNWI